VSAFFEAVAKMRAARYDARINGTLRGSLFPPPTSLRLVDW
jgi:hypothetical protein